jgi:hypothetical protein
VPTYEAMARDDINPTEGGRKYLEKSAILSVLAFLTKWIEEKAPR